MKVQNNPAGLLCRGDSAARRAIPTFLICCAALSFSGGNGQAQPGTVGRARDFTSVEYYPAPLQRQVKSRLSGAEAQPLAGGLLVIKQLKLETFNMDGSPQTIIEAPVCVYDTLHDTASSAGHLKLQSGDAKIRVEGDGFLWRQDNSFLTISNHVHSVIETGPETNNRL
jgi:hypothetical protein